MTKAMILADKHIKYIRDGGIDAVLREIANSSNLEIREARKILEDIDRRNIPVIVAEIARGPSCAESMVALKKQIDQGLREELDADYFEKNVMVLVRVMNRGLYGETHPMTKVLLYDNELNDRVARPVDDEWLRRRISRQLSVPSICACLAL